MKPRANVGLVSMPWTNLTEPALGPGILKSHLSAAGIDSKVYHMNLELLHYMKAISYNKISQVWALTDFLFSGIFHPKLSLGQTSMLALICRAAYEKYWCNSPEIERWNHLQALLINLREERIPDYLERCAKTLIAGNHSMIGFSCLFDQTVASLALAKKLRELDYSGMIVLGGYSVSGATSHALCQSFTEIDGVVSGDGEPAIVPLAEASIGMRGFSEIPNFVHREKCSRAPIVQGPRAEWDINDTKTPDYSDFFLDLENLKASSGIRVKNSVLPVESSRGCWWGQKNHCVFCGISKDSMPYRAKKPEQTFEMLTDLREKYSRNYVRFNDYILPHEYHSTLIPRLQSLDNKFELECEIKANLNVDHMSAMSDAGFVGIQPGIESFSTETLSSMKKGVTGIQNILTLVLGAEFGITINYNILFGLPEETASELEMVATTIPLLYHLPPPHFLNHVLVTRDSPLLAGFQSQANGAQIAPAPEYSLVFHPNVLSDRNFNMSSIAYYFEQPYSHSDEVLGFHSILKYQGEYWATRRAAGAALEILFSDKEATIYDSRLSHRITNEKLEAVETLIMKNAHLQLISRRKLYSNLQPFSEAEVDLSVSMLLEKGWLIEEKGKLLSLAVTKKD